MSENGGQPSRGSKPLLPVVEVLDGSESGEQASPSVGSSSAGKLPKRTKVTAVACQPCQKRKSKCDGARPTCSSCAQKGRTDCVYDSASDQRRTSALKQKIGDLHQENSALKDILISICSAFNNQNVEPTIRLIQQTLQHGDFSHVQELAEVIRKHQQSISPPNNIAGYQSPASYDANHPYPQQQRPMLYAYMGTNSNHPMQEGQPSPTAQQEWPPALGHREEQDEAVRQQQGYGQQGPYMYHA